MKPKRLILSRKGFDSEYGGCPSPIFEDKTMFSLPIPQEGDKITYGELCHGDINIGDVVAGLTGNRRSRESYDHNSCAHLDPHINIQTYPAIANSPCAKDWRGLFGQANGDETHLSDAGVDIGDIFLFYGSFKHVERDRDGRWRYKRGQREEHVLWGWLQIGDIREQVGRDAQIAKELPYAAHHPHLQYPGHNNTLYIGSDRLDLGAGPIALGSGVFPEYDQRLVLTREGKSKSHWQLPRWFYPDEGEGRAPLSRHDPKTNTTNRWDLSPDGRHTYLRSVALGQEFVLNLKGYPEADVKRWVTSLILGDETP